MSKSVTTETRKHRTAVDDDADFIPTNRHRILVFWGTLAVLSLPIVVAALQSADSLSRAIGDSAIIQLYAEDIPGRLPLVGVYSRFDFHHPGPLLYYLVAVPVHIFGAYGLSLTAAAVSIASFGGILLLLYRRGGATLFAVGVLLDIVLTRSMALDVLSAWNPYILILPIGLAIVLTWSVWCRDWNALPWLAFVGTFVLQAHIGTAPCIGFMLGSAALWATIERVRRRCPTRPILISASVLGVLWLPPVIDQFTSHPGNISQIVTAGTGGSGEPTLGLVNGLRLLGQLLGRVNPLTVASTEPIELITAARTASLTLLLVPAIVLSGSAVLAWRSRLRDELRLTGLLLGLTMTSTLFLTSLSGLPYLYLVRWIVVINCFIWVNLIWIIIRVIDLRITLRRTDGERTFRIPAAVVLAGSVSVLLAIAIIPLGPSTVHNENLIGSAAIRSLEGRIHDAVGDCDLIEVRSTSDQLIVGPAIASGVIAELHQHNVNAVAEDLFEYSHGSEHSLHGRSPECTLTITVSKAADLVPLPASDGDRVAAFDTLNRRERLQYQRISRKKLRGPLDDAGRVRFRQLRSEALSVRVTIVRHSKVA